MNRRGFFKSGAIGALASPKLLAELSGHSSSLTIGRDGGADRATPRSLLSQSSPEDERRQLNNIALCERLIHGCMRKHLITGYLPGQCSYNLGEYPCKKPWEIGEWDAQELDRLKAEGIGLIQLHEEWNDSQRLFGANKYSPLNPKGFRQFLDMAHQRGMKVIVYVSSGFFEKKDPEFRPEWARDQDLVNCFTNMRDAPLRARVGEHTFANSLCGSWRNMGLTEFTTTLGTCHWRKIHTPRRRMKCWRSRRRRSRTAH